MAQLVGTPCVICQQKITNELDARYCKECGKPRHDACVRLPDRPSDELCYECGVPVAAPEETRPKASRSESPQGLFPVAKVCPKCASPNFKKVKPVAWVAFVWDRVCKECGTRYTPPTPQWAALVFLCAGLLLGIGSLLFALFSIAAGDVLGLVCLGFTGLMGCLAIFHGLRCLFNPGDV